MHTKECLFLKQSFAEKKQKSTETVPTKAVTIKKSSVYTGINTPQN